MAKAKTTHICSSCGHQERKWHGRCPGCGGWNTFEEQAAAPASSSKARGRPAHQTRAGRATPMTQIDTAALPRRQVGIGELDRVLGGGLVPGSLTLVGGEPGIGKSTLLLSAAAKLASEDAPVLYVSAEESLSQTRLRAERTAALRDHVFLLAETDLAVVLSEVERLKPATLVVDSVQTVFAPELDAAPGSVSQVREVCSRLMHLAKREDISVFLVGHVTKDGAIAGPKTLEHMVDTVLSFEGTRSGPWRILRALKNRFGSVDELAVFEMRGDGLSPVENPSALFLAERPKDAPGSVVTCAIEGTRPILVEVQGLCSPCAFGNPRRTALGVDSTRCALLAAVLERRCGVSLAGQDIFINIAGGVTLNETAADLPVALALASSMAGVALPMELLVLGEVGLSGEIRGVQRTAARLAEARRLGFTSALIPATGIDKIETPRGMALMPVRTLQEALDAVLSRQVD